MYLFLSLKWWQSSILWSELCCFHLLYQCCHSLLLIAICCHSLSLAVLLVVTRFHSLSLAVPLVVTRFHSLPLVVPLVATRCHSLSLVFTGCTTRLSFYKGSLWTMCPVEMGTFHQLKFKGGSLITLSWLDHVKWRSGTLSFWYVFSAGFVAVSQVMTWLHHVTCRNANVSFWYEFPPRLVIVAFVIFALWRV